METLTRDIDTATRQPDAPDICRHYWIIDAPHGLTSRGKCRYCHEERQFHNSMRNMDMVRQYGYQWTHDEARNRSPQAARKPIAYMKDQKA